MPYISGILYIYSHNPLYRPAVPCHILLSISYINTHTYLCIQHSAIPCHMLMVFLFVLLVDTHTSVYSILISQAYVNGILFISTPTHTYLNSILPSHAICVWYFYTLVHTHTSIYNILINSHNHTSVYSICHPMPYVSGILYINTHVHLLAAFCHPMP